MRHGRHRRRRLAAVMILVLLMLCQNVLSVNADEDEVWLINDLGGFSGRSSSEVRNVRSRGKDRGNSTPSSLATPSVLAAGETEQEEIKEVQELQEEDEVLADDVYTTEPVTYDLSDLSGRSAGELLWGYFEDALFTKKNSTGKITLKKAPRRNGLSGNELVVYNYLRGEIEKIAAGKRSSSEIDIPLSKLYPGIESGIQESELDLSGPVYTRNGDTYEKNTDIVNEGYERMESLVETDIARVFASLIADCPYEMYWCNKVVDVTEYNIRVQKTGEADAPTAVFSFDPACLSFRFRVAEDYRLSQSDLYQADTEKTGAAVHAADNAKKIVADVSGKSDYEKLEYYRDQICARTSYNYDALTSGDSDAYGGISPWQVINVFDDDLTNQVVCEGYAKAFQYLCDMTSFEGDVDCISPTGVMNGGAGDGSHMWNIVNMEDGRNYLVDVTNCDEGTVGAPDKMFLRGYTAGSVSGGYTVGIDRGSTDPFISYAYDDDTKVLYSTGELTLAGTDYAKPAEDVTVPVTGVSLDKTVISLTVGQKSTLHASVLPSDAFNKKVTWKSSNPSAAAVSSDGTVSAIKAGTAVITVTTADGGKKASCTVTVKAAAVAVTGVALDRSTLTLVKGNTGKLSAVVKPSDAANKSITWKSSNPSVAAVSSDGTVRALKAGTAVITVTAADGGKKASCTVTVTEPVPVVVKNGWYRENGRDFWYENNVKQGTKGRGKEIYDPDSDAWYWLDAVLGGAKAVNKEVYQESSGGKWVRYDAAGHMVKGWFSNEKGTYYYDLVTGAMLKGEATVDRIPCYFDTITGVGHDGWRTISGKSYWYEHGERQGTKYDRKGVRGDGTVRGREIYDPESAAWYWLDAVYNGAKAVDKEVWMPYIFQGEASETGGKWVRYNAGGGMIKGWYTLGSRTYYYDPVTGAMAKGKRVINGKMYIFDDITGVLR